MTPIPRKVLVPVIVFLCCVFQGAAQERHLGTVQSPKGIGFFYAYGSRTELNHFSFALDFDGIFRGHTRRPGFRLGYQKHFSLPVYRLADGTDLDFFYGPGVVAGAVRDGEDFQGPMVALRGVLGLCFIFPERPFTLGFAISGDLGVHMQRVAGQNTNVLRLYRGGLRRIWMPEIHLSYRF
ncbi:MAG: hypothetical protein LIQ26_02045 [Bacteroidota bacterium]|nr:hypothetical protein [Bacteroidota bacterium]